MTTRKTLEIFELRWDRVFALDGVPGAWRLWKRKPKRYVYMDFARRDGVTKKDAISMSADHVRDWAPSQLLIYNRNGRIGKGRNAERSFGADSRRRAG